METHEPLHLPCDEPRVVEALFTYTLHVAQHGGDDFNDGFSWATPLETLQKAFEVLGLAGEAGGRIEVSNGWYGVSAQIEINAPIVVSGFTGDPADVHVFRASGTTRVFHLNHAGAWIEFLTVRDGIAQDAPYNSDSPANNYQAGGNILIGPDGGTVADCVVSNGTLSANNMRGGNIAVHGAAGRVLRCVIANGRGSNAGNSGGGGISIANSARVEQCLIIGNSDGALVDNARGSAVHMLAGTLLNCAIVRNTSLGNSGAVYVLGGAVVNCAIADNATAGNPPFMGGSAWGVANLGSGDIQNMARRFQNCAIDAPANTYFVACLTDPARFAFADAANNDYRPSVLSVLRGNGAEAARESETDLAGNPLRVGGKPDIGCYEYQGGGAFEFLFGAGPGPMVKTAPFEAVFYAAVETAEAGVGYVWDFGDGTVSNFTSSAASFAISHTYATPGVYTVEVTANDGAAPAKAVARADYVEILPVGAVLHVRNESQTPAYPYDTFDNAFQNIHAAVAASADGTSIIVSNGVYDVKTEIFINKAVTVSGFTGNPGDVHVRRGTTGSSTIRVFHLDHAGARLEFMTLRDGAFIDRFNVWDGNHQWGGNVRIGPAGGTVADCVVRDSTSPSWRGGGMISMHGANALVLRCLVENGAAGGVVGGIYMEAGRVEQSLVRGCSHNDNVGGLSGSAVYMPSGGSGAPVVVNCTLVGNRTHASAPGATVGAVNANARIVNTVIVDNATGNPPNNNPDSNGGTVYSVAGQETRFYNCLTDLSTLTGNNCLVHTPGVDFVDAPRDYRPVSQSAARNAGTTGVVAILSGTDLDRMPRFVGKIDIGCYEYPFLGGTLLMVR